MVLIIRGQSILFIFCKLAEHSLIKRCQNWTFKMSKIIQIFLSFLMKNESLGAQFLLKLFFCNFNFKTPLFAQFLTWRHESFRGCSEIYTVANWNTLGIMVTTHFNHTYHGFFLHAKAVFTKKK